MTSIKSSLLKYMRRLSFLYENCPFLWIHFRLSLYKISVELYWRNILLKLLWYLCCFYFLFLLDPTCMLHSLIFATTRGNVKSNQKKMSVSRVIFFSLVACVTHLHAWTSKVTTRRGGGFKPLPLQTSVAKPQRRRNYLQLRLFSFPVFSYSAYFHYAPSPTMHIFILRIL